MWGRGLMYESEKGEGYAGHERRTRKDQRKDRKRESHQGLGLGPVGNLRLWTTLSIWGSSHRAIEKGPVQALKVRGQLANAAACLGQHVPAKCSATIWTTSSPF